MWPRAFFARSIPSPVARGDTEIPKTYMTGQVSGADADQLMLTSFKHCRQHLQEISGKKGNCSWPENIKIYRNRTKHAQPAFIF